MSFSLPIDAALGRMAIAAIAAYQRYVSPYKGFVCAHRVWHGGLSCSQYAKHLISTEGVLAGLLGLRKRFAECRDAAESLRRARMLAASREFDDEFDRPAAKPTLEETLAMPSETQTPESDHGSVPSNCGHGAIHGADCFCNAATLPPSSCQTTDCSGCDLPGTDCPGCDLPVDCGGCG